MSDMFCFQCQQTAGGSGCVRTGVCGKQPTTAHLQDILVCRLIRLAEVCEQNSEHPREVTQLLADGLFTTLTNVNFDDEAIRAAYELTKLEGIIPALESAHALGALEKLNFKTDDVVVLTVSGRGDKDVETYLNYKL